MDLTNTQIERWRLLLEEARSDTEWLEYHRKRDARRLVAQRGLLELLDEYLGGRVDTERFRAVFDQRTRGEWDLFGLKGMSGAMILNMFVKYIPDQGALTDELREVLPVPEAPHSGREKMRRFQRYVGGLISSGEVLKRQAQPARIPFFVGAWWHLQDTESWPVFYVSARKALQVEGLYSPASDPVENYFAFRDAFLALASNLGTNSWELKHLCSWHESRDGDPPDVAAVETAPTPRERQIGGTQLDVADGVEDGVEEPSKGAEAAGAQHEQVQLLLAKIGRKFGCRIWIAANDHNKRWDGERLGDLSLTSLPSLGIGNESQRIIELIDVLWLRGTNSVVAAFEVERTTSIYSGLPRMSDLATLSPNLNFPLYIVAPKSRMDKVRRELSRPTFQYLELHKRCGFFSDEDLIHEAEAIVRWASDPAAIERLAHKVGDVSVGE
jgi:hypothetical protein